MQVGVEIRDGTICRTTAIPERFPIGIQTSTKNQTKLGVEQRSRIQMETVGIAGITKLINDMKEDFLLGGIIANREGHLGELVDTVVIVAVFNLDSTEILRKERGKDRNDSFLKGKNRERRHDGQKILAMLF
jgi:hypothetical protein